MRPTEPYFPLSHEVPRVDDRRIISGIIFVIRNGLRWRDRCAHTLFSAACIAGTFTFGINHDY